MTKKSTKKTEAHCGWGFLLFSQARDVALYAYVQGATANGASVNQSIQDFIRAWNVNDMTHEAAQSAYYRLGERMRG